METVELAKLFQDNLYNILTPNGYKNIINRNNNLSRFDILNRILIEIQYPGAYDVRTEEEWIIDNRNVKKNSDGINLILPLYTYKYVDTETNEDINIDELTLDELNAAIRYGVIRKEENIETSYIVRMYDIRQTNRIDDSKYTISKPEMKSSVLIKIFQDVTGCEVVNSDITYYSKSKNELTVSKQSYIELANSLCDMLVEHYMRIVKKDNNGELSEYDMDLVKYTLQYSIDTLFMSTRECNFDIIRHTDTDKILMVLNIVDSLLYGISDSINYTGNQVGKDASESIEILRKAENLLNVMEANNISKTMKGA